MPNIVNLSEMKEPLSKRKKWLTTVSNWLKISEHIFFKGYEL